MGYNRHQHLEPIDPATLNLKTATPTQLDRAADWLLREDARDRNRMALGWGVDDAPILNHSALALRRRREIQTEAGVPDPSMSKNSMGQQGMFNRQEPHGGRSVSSDHARKHNSASFYGEGRMNDGRPSKRMHD